MKSDKARKIRWYGKMTRWILQLLTFLEANPEVSTPEILLIVTGTVLHGPNWAMKCVQTESEQMGMLDLFSWLAKIAWKTFVCCLFCRLFVFYFDRILFPRSHWLTYWAQCYSKQSVKISIEPLQNKCPLRTKISQECEKKCTLRHLSPQWIWALETMQATTLEMSLVHEKTAQLTQTIWT